MHADSLYEHRISIFLLLVCRTTKRWVNRNAYAHFIMKKHYVL